MRIVAGLMLNEEQSRVVFYPINKIILMYFALTNTTKSMGEEEIKWEGKTLLDLDYEDDLRALDKNVYKLNEILKVLRVQNREGAKISLEIRGSAIVLPIVKSDKVSIYYYLFYLFSFPEAVYMKGVVI